jgi:hypothetical protein
MTSMVLGDSTLEYLTPSVSAPLLLSDEYPLKIVELVILF